MENNPEKDALKQDQEFKVKEKEIAPKRSPVELTKALSRYGGFAIVENTIEGALNINPEKKARRRIFFEDDNNKEYRREIKSRMKMMLQILNMADNAADLVTAVEQKIEAKQKSYNENLGRALHASRTMETSYRSLNLFFKNSESDKVKNIGIINGDPDDVKDTDSPVFQLVSETLDMAYDRLDLRDNYSLLVIPGFLGSKKVVDTYARIAHKNKVMLLTDYENHDSPDMVLSNFERANLTGGDAYLSNVMMTGNWLVGRGAVEEAGEEEDLYVPPSAALAGKVYNTLMSQVSAGRKFGALNEVDAVRFKLKKSEIAQLEKAGIVPMVNEYGKVMAFSAKTLFNGDNIGLQTYSVVRVFDYVTKVIMDFLNRRAFENFNVNTQMEIRSQIIRYLDSITGPGKLIEKFSIKRFERDPKQKDRVYLDIHMVPYFPAKNFVIKMDGQKGNDENSWDTEYEAG